MAFGTQHIWSALQRLRDYFAPANPLEAGCCVICQAGHPNLGRLALIVGKLSVGKRVTLAKVHRGLDESFKTVEADLEYLISELRLPIELSRRGIVLKEPVILCERCARIGQPSAFNEHLMRDRSLEGEHHHKQAVRLIESAAPPFPI